jgi:hypothetical protein
MHVPQVAVIDELPRLATPGLEVKRAPGDQRGLVGKAGEMKVRFGVELWHADQYRIRDSGFGIRVLPSRSRESLITNSELLMAVRCTQKPHPPGPAVIALSA